MFEKIKESYDKISEIINADGIIRSGEAMLEAYKENPDIYRDAIHASYGTGRYLIGCIWYQSLFEEIPNKHITDFDEYISEENLNLVKKVLSKIENKK